MTTPVNKTVDVRKDNATDAIASGLMPKIGKLVQSGSVVEVYLAVDGVLGDPLTASLTPKLGQNTYAEARFRLVSTDMDEASVAARAEHG